MLLLGLTGDIAAGKTTVAHLLQKRGAAHIDSDSLVHELYARPDFAEKVVGLFSGIDITVPGGVRVGGATGVAIDRARLAAHVFKDPAAMRRLEALVHPAVAALRDEKIVALRALGAPPPACVLEAVKLVESGQHLICDAVWWIRASHETQYARLVQQRSMGAAAANARLAQQPSAEAKRALLQGVPCVEMWNDGSRNELDSQVAREWEKLMETPPRP